MIQLSSIPRRPGVYLLKGSGEKVLYVGKAKDLRVRLSSYFRKSTSLDARKSSMMKNVRDFSFIATENELEALALEANLIKQYRPRFNIILRDDKNYPYLRLSVQEQWPRLEIIRRVKNDGAMYFGPYVPAGSMREALSFIKKHFGLRPCRYGLQKPMRPCIEYEMGRCLAPCAGLVTREDYMLAVEEVVMFLRGRRTELLEELQDRMGRLSDEMRYEEAAEVRDRLSALRRALESQKVISPELGDIDVIGFYRGTKDAVFQVFFIRSGMMIGARDFYLKDVSGLSPKELYRSFIISFYSKDIVPPREIVLGTRPGGVGQLRAWLKKGAWPPAKGARSPAAVRIGRAVSHRYGKGAVSITVPKDGKLLELLRMADENAGLVYEGREKKGLEGVTEELQGRLGLEAPPLSIGAFDVSTFMGSGAVGAFVCWSEGEFQKDRYRRVRIKTVAGIDDYAMIKETVSRVLGDIEVPDLLVIDGGRGHLNAALEAIGKTSPGKGPVTLAIAKKPDRLFISLIEEPIALSDRSSSSVLLRKIRDEAHRFAISYHKKLRDRSLIASPLESVPGIGKKRRLALLRRFKSLEAIKQAPLEELARVPGMSKPAAGALKRTFGEDK